jgi:hypothetical protein
MYAPRVTGTHRYDIQVLDTRVNMGAATFSLHTLASPSGRNVNYDGKQLSGKKNF